MATFRTMLFDHCVITFPVDDGRTSPPDFGAHRRAIAEGSSTERRSDRNNCRRLHFSVIVALLISMVLSILIALSKRGDFQLSADRGCRVVGNLAMSRN